MTTIKLMTASAAAISLLLVAFGQRDDPVQQSAVAKDVPTFEYQWLAAAIPVMLLSAALEKAAAIEPPAVKVVATETITPSAADARAVVAVAPKPQQEKHVELDTCQRHGMHKVATHGGRSWRCRR